MQDQAWSALRNVRNDIKRIADSGIREPDDILVMRMVMCVVSAELCMRDAEIKQQEEQ